MDIGEICKAIDGRRVVEFDYDGHHRVVQPAAAGRHRTTGNPLLRGYQIGGTSNSGVVPDWRLFSIDRTSNGAAGRHVRHRPPRLSAR